MRKTFLAAAVGLALFVGTVVPALASAQWCDGDMVVTTPGVTLVTASSHDSLVVVKGP